MFAFLCCIVVVVIIVDELFVYLSLYGVKLVLKRSILSCWWLAWTDCWIDTAVWIFRQWLKNRTHTLLLFLLFVFSINPLIIQPFSLANSNYKPQFEYCIYNNLLIFFISFCVDFANFCYFFLLWFLLHIFPPLVDFLCFTLKKFYFRLFPNISSIQFLRTYSNLYLF